MPSPPDNSRAEARIIRMLRTLGYPGVKSLDPPSQCVESLELSRIVSWLEDRKVRHYLAEQRDPLRNPGPAWRDAFQIYLRELEYPYIDEDRDGKQLPGEDRAILLRSLSWLVGNALACEFEDKRHLYKAAKHKIVRVPLTLKTVPAEAVGEVSTQTDGEGARTDHSKSGGVLDPLPSIQLVPDPSTESVPLPAPPPSLSPSPWSPKFLSDLESTCVSLGVTFLPNDVVGTLEALLVASRSTAERHEAGLAVKESTGSGAVVEENEGDEASFPPPTLSDFTSGVSTGDDTCDRVAIVLRMLHISDLRRVQHEVNSILLSTQDITANPRTNSNLGKVGR
ncbi:unnamed protein product [Choristocarpus tenellus]